MTDSHLLMLRLLPLLAGRGWEGVRFSRKALPLPNPPLRAGEGAQPQRRRAHRLLPPLAGEGAQTNEPFGLVTALTTHAQLLSYRLLPLLAGGGWEGVRSSHKASPLPNPPLRAGEGAQQPNPSLLAGEAAQANKPFGLVTALTTHAQLLSYRFLPMPAWGGWEEVRPCSSPNPPLHAVEGAQP